MRANQAVEGTAPRRRLAAPSPLTAFAGTAFLQSPLTFDEEMK